MPVAKVRTAAKVGRTSARVAARKSKVTRARPGRAKKTARRARSVVVVVLSKNTERAGVRFERAAAKLVQSQERLRQSVAAARAQSGQGRGKRPANAKSADRARSLVAKAQAAFASARSAARDARKAHRLSLLQDKQRAQIAGIREQALVANAAGEQKAAALIARLVETFRGKVAKRVLSAESRRGRKRLKVADRKTRVAAKRSSRQLARAAGKKVKRKIARG